jgi:HD-GYP domain-containing protein (c-di-GMP phosphodiesterase class II)
MKTHPAGFQPAANRLPVFISISALLVCLYYTFAAAYLAPYPGLEFEVDWIVDDIPACQAGAAWCEADRDMLQIGDQLITIGNLSHEDYLDNKNQIPFEGYQPGESIPITFLRNGEERSASWVILGPTIAVRLNRLTEFLIYFPFWLAGTGILLLLRPQDSRWRLLILFNYATAIYLAIGMAAYYVAYSNMVLHALTWLIVPIYLHLHLTIPNQLLQHRRRYYVYSFYIIAIPLSLLELFQILPEQAFFLGLVPAILGSLGLLTYRLFTPLSASERLALRLMFLGIGLALIPSLILVIIPLLFQVVFPQITGRFISFVAIPLLPFFYIYAIYKRSMGGFEVRANRLLSLYTFLLLYGLVLILIFSLASEWLHLADQSLIFSLMVTFVFVLAAPPLRTRYQRWFDRLAYGVQHNPQEIVRAFALQLPSVFDPGELIRLLSHEMAPSLLIRESALYQRPKTGFSLLYADGISLPDPPAGMNELEDLLKTAGKYRPPETIAQGVFDWVRLAIALQAGENTVGVWLLGRRDPDDFYSHADILLLQTLGSQVTPMLENMRLYGETRRRLERLQSLMDIDTAINASLDLNFTLNILLDQVKQRSGVDAADVLLFNPKTVSLEFSAGRGFHSDALHHTRLRLGEGHAGQAALERRLIFIQNLDATAGGFVRSPMLPMENFKSYCAVPLLSKGQLKGVLEVFYRKPLAPDPDWFDFLESLSVQAAIAIDNATLFNDLQRSNTGLLLAYDTTIEGWSHALDLRDEGTHGHTQRVTDKTERLARTVGIDEAALVHMRRGTLLHDMGKMGIPDSILLKPGKLTDEEWVVMRKHPVYAYEMLSPIAYLRPALDIPYCHHEKWDGSGYPRGLKGEDIPLAARIFAVVDVWDAVTSDRPYRSAWTMEKSREFLHEQSGKHFDPQIVPVFLDIFKQLIIG